MKNKRLVFIILGVIVVGLGILFSFVFSSQTKKQTPVVQKEALSAASPPSIILTQNAPTNVVFSFTGQSKQIPSQLPVYTYSWTHYDAPSLATTFGFTSAPIKLAGNSQTTVIWNTSTGSFSINSGSTSDNISYSLYTRGQTNLTASDAVSISNFLLKTFPSSNQLSLKLENATSSGIRNTRIDDDKNPQLKSFSFVSYINSSYPVTGYSFDVGTASVIVDKDGVIRSLTYMSPPIIQSETTQKPVLSIQDAVNGLNANKGILVYAGINGTNSFSGLSPSFNSVSLDSFRIVYYPNQNHQLLTPFYLFDGKAINQEKETLDVEYAVAATE